jgi:hypothetical protein
VLISGIRLSDRRHLIVCSVGCVQQAMTFVAGSLKLADICLDPLPCLHPGAASRQHPAHYRVGAAKELPNAADSARMRASIPWRQVRCYIDDIDLYDGLHGPGERDLQSPGAFR